MLYIDCLMMRQGKRDKPNHTTINPPPHPPKTPLHYHYTTTRPDHTIIDPLHTHARTHTHTHTHTQRESPELNKKYLFFV